MKKFYRLGSYQTMQGIGLSIAAFVFISGCAGMRAPNEQLAESKSAVSDAASAGSGEFAPLLLKSAIDKMEAAERAMGQTDYLRARRLAEQAQVEAELAAATARTAKAVKAASALQEGNRVLRQELDRKAQ